MNRAGDGAADHARGSAVPWAGAFHDRQEVTQAGDGSVRVRFRAAGMLELAWRLFTGGDKVRIVTPDNLRELKLTQLRKALAAHEGEARKLWRRTEPALRVPRLGRPVEVRSAREPLIRRALVSEGSGDLS